jgi:hypothetical protein
MVFIQLFIIKKVMSQLKSQYYENKDYYKGADKIYNKGYLFFSKNLITLIFINFYDIFGKKFWLSFL